MEQIFEAYIETVPTILLILIIGATLYLLSKGADILVDEAVSLSVRWGIPKMVIGATIVSLGTTLPEASVSVAAAVGGQPDIALGNAVGSIICDTSMIIGIAALIRPLPVQRQITDKQGWLHLGSAVLLVLVALPWSTIGQGLTQTGRVPQWSGVLFLILLAAYLYWTVRRSRTLGSQPGTAEETAVHEDPAPTVLVLLKLLAGLVLIIMSSRLLIPSVQVVALRAGIPKSIIAATLVAFGTSLPELSTAVHASRKGHGELAIGNIIGADILNVLFVVGASAAVTQGGLSVPKHFYLFHFPVMLAVVIIFRITLLSKSRTIGRIPGALLLLFYLFFVIASYTLI